MEKLARLILWLVISGVLVVGFAVAPLMLVAQASAEAELRARLDRSELKLEETIAELSAPPSERLPLRTMGTYLSGLDHREAVGRVWFTNVSSRSGYVCLNGVATSEVTGERASSLPACTKVEPFSSAKVQVMFAGGDLRRACPKSSDCSFSIAEADDATEETVASR